MSQPIQPPITRIRTEKLLILALMVCGLLFIGYFGWGFVRNFLLFRTNPLKPGITNVEAIRPWMTIRYIGVAYGVPQEYIFFELEIPFDRKDSDMPLRNFNDKHKLGPPTPGEDLPVLQKIKTIIQQYQNDPVATGLDEIQPWMTIQYVANATGVPASYIFEYLDLPNIEDNQYLPLFDLGRKYHYGRRNNKDQSGQRGEGDKDDGPRVGDQRGLLFRIIEEAISQYEATDSSLMENNHEHG